MISHDTWKKLLASCTLVKIITRVESRLGLFPLCEKGINSREYEYVPPELLLLLNPTESYDLRNELCNETGALSDTALELFIIVQHYLFNFFPYCC